MNILPSHLCDVTSDTHQSQAVEWCDQSSERAGIAGGPTRQHSLADHDIRLMELEQQIDNLLSRISDLEKKHLPGDPASKVAAAHAMEPDVSVDEVHSLRDVELGDTSANRRADSRAIVDEAAVVIQESPHVDTSHSLDLPGHSLPVRGG